MKREDISEAVGNISTNHIQEAAPAKRNSKKRIWMRCGVAAAIFSVLAVTMLPLIQDDIRPPAPSTNNPLSTSTQMQDTVTPPISISANGLHLIQLAYAKPAVPEISTDFIIYINASLYTGREENGTYIIRPTVPMSEELPECSLQIHQIADASPAAVAESIKTSLNASYVNVGDITEATIIDGLFLHADNGNAWNAEQVDVTITDNLLGGSYILTSHYFTEATEGHGVRFADMVGTFKAVTSSDSSAMPAYLAELYRTISIFAPAFFTDNTSEINDILAQDTQIYTYGTDVMDDVSIASVDYSISGDETPTAAVVSVKHRISTEDSYNCLTIELTYAADSRWVVHFAGIEK